MVAGGVFGLLLAALFFWVGWHEHRPNMWQGALCGLGVGLVLPVFVAPTLLVSIVIEDGMIALRLCRRWTLARKPLAALKQVDVGLQGSGAKFYFTDGSSISFLGAHLRILEQMCLCIRELRPEGVSFRIGRRLALLLKTIKAVNPKGNLAAESPAG